MSGSCHHSGRWIAAGSLAAACAGLALGGDVVSTVGVEGRLVWSYEGGPVRALAPDERGDVLVRIAGEATDGRRTLYDLRFMGQRAGTFDLRSSLQHRDGTPVTDGEPALVTINSLLPDDHRGDLVEIAGIRVHGLGGYRVVLIGAGVLWLVPVVVLGWRRLRRRPTSVEMPPPDAPASLADQLRPLVEAAMRGELGVDDRARLERMLLGFWRERLGLRECGAVEAIERMRRHPEAGELVIHLERWLHRPWREGETPVDVVSLLLPYRGAAPAAAPRVGVVAGVPA